MKSGQNSTRRNRNIGTAKSGHGQDNRLVISICDPRAAYHYESLKSYTAVPREINGKTDFNGQLKIRKLIMQDITLSLLGVVEVRVC